MYKKILGIGLSAVVLLNIAACDKEEKYEATVATAVATTEKNTVEETETIPAIDRIDAPRESEPATNKATVIDGDNQSAKVDESVENTSESTTPTEAPKNSDKTSGTERVVTEYEWFMALSGDEQKEYMYSFPTIDDFISWLENAEKEYNDLHPPIMMDGTPIDAEEILEVIE